MTPCRTPKAGCTTTPTATSWRQRTGWRPTPIRTCGPGCGPCSSAAQAASRRRRCGPRRRGGGAGGAPVPPEDALALEDALLTKKGWDALGAVDAAERSRALDLLGFDRQLVFSTFAPTQ